MMPQIVTFLRAAFFSLWVGSMAFTSHRTPKYVIAQDVASPSRVDRSFTVTSCLDISVPVSATLDNRKFPIFDCSGELRSLTSAKTELMTFIFKIACSHTSSGWLASFLGRLGAHRIVSPNKENIALHTSCTCMYLTKGFKCTRKGWQFQPWNITHLRDN